MSERAKATAKTAETKNKITIASARGAECLTGLFIFEKVEADKKYTSPPVKLDKHIFGIILGVEYNYEFVAPPLRFIVTGGRSSPEWYCINF